MEVTLQQQDDVFMYCSSPHIPIQSPTTHATTLQITASQSVDKPYDVSASIVCGVVIAD